MKKIINKISRFVPDRICISLMYYKHFHRFPSLNNPKTFNEKLQWLKLHDRRPEYIKMVDKFAVKQYIASVLGEEFIIPTLGVWDNADDIDFDKLPKQFVLKCTHDSHSIIVCKDKSKLDFEAARKTLNNGLKRNLFYYGREWPYKSVPPRIIAEKYMTDAPESDSFTDYKFFCFNGIADCVMVCLGRGDGETKFYFFDKQWKLKRLNVRGKKAPSDFTIPKPICMDQMFKVAEILSSGIPFARIDLYQSNEKIYFGEITLYPASGFDANILPEADLYFGKLINLKKAIKKENSK